MNKHLPDQATMATPSLHLSGRPRLRVLGTAISLLEELRVRAEADLGIEVVFDNNDFLTTQHKAAQEPDSYDIYDQCFHNLDIVWYWRAIQPIEIGRIALWDEINDLTKTGHIGPNARLGQGDAPVKKLFVQPNLELGDTPSSTISMLPTTHNFDSFAYRTDVAPNTVSMNSWAALLDERWAGRAALVDEPAIGIFDAALAAQASGLMSFDNIGAMTVDEIDRLIGLLEERKKNGYFRAFWRTAEDAARLMVRGETDIQSMWSTGISILNGQGVPVEQAVPAEGYRAWHGGLCLARHLSGRMRDVAYEYLNWWISGWPGSVVARQGYYISTPERSRQFMSVAEWDYWYGGLPAACDLPGPDGTIRIRAGSVRSGGSYWQRANCIAVWNTTMDEHNYLVRRWMQLVER
ncbi:MULTISPECIES: extracellular solute-binding protein [Ensifer]|jgi:putative spermidine/putrescine transport system substrate-binding protein|uniref:Extracellular solute-binding protein n=1 Tax=Ensifer canadensis TaxID=555315 RepID=A0AAW4FQ95_9HYPH|nr:MULTISPECIES: extracellular solute-binding protein [Ensifer]AHK46386.1 ABC transporter, binding protein [Ensifer adhaerens OV14]MBM3093469.1 extracellular solute-binding protein [Ensifer canadensis]NOV17640.1 extracellular solute-binding protein [Ensifer canadensis]OMQ42006.1 signal peptide prediction [Ensifer sp. 1H6]UBI78467.1 extracellular solute-binding protein [Ensifer canadensis]